MDIVILAISALCYHPLANGLGGLVREVFKRLKKRSIAHFALPQWLLLAAASAFAQQQQGVQVTVVPLEQLWFKPHYSAPASTLSLNDSSISVETSGRLLNIPVRVGDSLKKDQLMAEIDCRSNLSLQRQALADVQSAEARLTLAKRQITRTQKLLREQNISEEILNQREADLLTAEADIAARRAALDKADLEVRHCRILAPFEGIVIKREASEGEWISPGQPLLRLLDSKRLTVSAQIPLSQVESLQQAEAFDLVVANKHYGLELRRLLPIVNSIARNREARFDFVDEQALPGSSGRLVWQAVQAHLPADIPVRRNGVLGIFLEEGGTARFLGLSDALEGHAVVAADLAPNSLLIIEGRHALNDGDKVIPQN